MLCIRNSILLLATVGALQVNSITQSFATEQSVVKKSDCTQVGGKLRPSGFKPTDKYQYICTYSAKYDRKCQKQMGDERLLRSGAEKMHLGNDVRIVLRVLSDN